MTFYEITDGDLSFSTGTSPSEVVGVSEGSGASERVKPCAGGWNAKRGVADILEFREMPPSLLRKSLDTLVKRGKAQIIKGEGEAGEGVRFL